MPLRRVFRTRTSIRCWSSHTLHPFTDAQDCREAVGNCGAGDGGVQQPRGCAQRRGRSQHSRQVPGPPARRFVHFLLLCNASAR